MMCRSIIIIIFLQAMIIALVQHEVHYEHVNRCRDDCNVPKK